MKTINESFCNHKEFENWAQLQNPNSVFKIKIDNWPADYWSIVIHKKEHFLKWGSDLILLAPLEIYNYDVDDNLYNINYPQIGPIDWRNLIVYEEYTEDEIVKIITGNPNAKVWLGDCEEKEN